MDPILVRQAAQRETEIVGEAGDQPVLFPSLLNVLNSDEADFEDGEEDEVKVFRNSMEVSNIRPGEGRLVC